jgi:transposase InsO family protein
MKCGFVEAHRGRWPVRLICRVPAVSPGGYPDWRGRPASSTAQAQRREALVASLEDIHGEAKARPGSLRLHAEPIASGRPSCASSADTVAEQTREHGIVAKTWRKFRSTTDSNHDRPVAENVASRRFEPAANRTWTADIASITAGEGRLYLAAVEDPYSRWIVGRSISERIDSRLVVDAPETAVAGRLPGAGPVAHPDRGGPYAGEQYQRPLAGHGITCRMSRRANCWDNAPMGSFFASLKKGLVICHASIVG